MGNVWLEYGKGMVGARKAHEWHVPASAVVERKQATVLPFGWFGLTLSSPKSRWDTGLLQSQLARALEGLSAPEKSVLSQT